MGGDHSSGLDHVGLGGVVAHLREVVREDGLHLDLHPDTFLRLLVVVLRPGQCHGRVCGERGRWGERGGR